MVSGITLQRIHGGHIDLFQVLIKGTAAGRLKKQSFFSLQMRGIPLSMGFAPLIHRFVKGIRQNVP